MPSDSFLPETGQRNWICPDSRFIPSMLTEVRVERVPAGQPTAPAESVPPSGYQRYSGCQAGVSLFGPPDAKTCGDARSQRVPCQHRMLACDNLLDFHPVRYKASGLAEAAKQVDRGI